MTDKTNDATDDSTHAEAPADPDSDDGPNLGDDDYVDIDPDVAQEVSDATADETDTTTDDETDEKSSTAPESTTDETDKTGGDRVSPGDLYCNALGMGAMMSRNRYGESVEDRDEIMNEYAALAHDLQLDEYVDQWVAEQGGIDELTPGQAIMISTAMFGGLVLMDDPAMVENIGEEVGA